MTWPETLRTGWSAIASHRLRSVLTMLGIIIGVSSVILTVGLGQGAQDKVRDQISALGSNLLVVSPGSSTSSSGVRGGFGTASTLTLQDADGHRRPTVVPEVEQRGTDHQRRRPRWSPAPPTGRTPAGRHHAAWLEVRSRELQSGRFFTQAEVEQPCATSSCSAPTPPRELFGGAAPSGRRSPPTAPR